LLPQALCSMVAVLLGGRLVDKIGVRAVVIPGLIILGISMYMQTSLTLTESMSTFQIALCLSGFSLGLCIQPLTVSMLSNIKPKMLSQASAMNTTVRFVMSSLAISIISTFLTARSKFHFANMAMRATPDSGMGHMITLLQAFFISKGQSAQNALAAAIYSVSGLLQQRSYMLAVNDVFWLTLTLIGVAIVATIFVGGFKKKSSKPVETVELSDEEQKALEEAMMAI